MYLYVAAAAMAQQSGVQDYVWNHHAARVCVYCFTGYSVFLVGCLQQLSYGERSL
jgi:chloramphenicol 3-O-phosphotransferase